MREEELECIEFGKATVIGTTPKGHWRVSRPVIDMSLCRKCWLCIDYCIEGCMSKEDEKINIDLRFCKGCGVCSNECPSDAIKMVKEYE